MEEHGGNETCNVFGYSIFHYHQFGGEFKEGEYASIEHEAEHGYIPESAIAEKSSKVGEFESFFGLGVKSCS